MMRFRCVGSQGREISRLHPVMAEGIEEPGLDRPFVASVAYHYLVHVFLLYDFLSIHVVVWPRHDVAVDDPVAV